MGTGEGEKELSPMEAEKVLEEWTKDKVGNRGEDRIRQSSYPRTLPPSSPGSSLPFPRLPQSQAPPQPYSFPSPSLPPLPSSSSSSSSSSLPLPRSRSTRVNEFGDEIADVANLDADAIAALSVNPAAAETMLPPATFPRSQTLPLPPPVPSASVPVSRSPFSSPSSSPSAASARHPYELSHPESCVSSASSSSSFGGVDVHEIDAPAEKERKKAERRARRLAREQEEKEKEDKRRERHRDGVFAPAWNGVTKPANDNASYSQQLQPQRRVKRNEFGDEIVDDDTGRL